MSVGHRFGGLLAYAALAACLATPPPQGADAVAPAPAAPTTQVIWPGAAPGQLYRTGEVRAFEIKQGDAVIGRSWGRYAGPTPGASGHHRFETRIELELPGRPRARSEGELVIDGKGRLVSGFERSDAAELSYARRDELVVFRAGKLTDEIGYRPDAVDTAFMAHSAIFHEELMFGLREIAVGDAKWRLLSLSGGPPQPWEATISAGATEDAATIRTNLGETIELQRGRITRIRVPDDGLEIVAMAPGRTAWPSWEIQGPTTLAYTPPKDANFDIQPVELPGRAGEPKLVGELLIPKDAGGPRPGVVFISANGQQDRYGFAGPPPVDVGTHVITDALAQAEFVVLRFDERGFGASEAGPLSFDAQLEDARRALRTLTVQDAVDPDRLVVVGHGEGGLRALMLAAERPTGIRGVALLAAPGRPYGEILRHQSETTMSQVPPELRAQARRDQAEMIEGLLTGKKTPPELRDQADWIREIARVDPPALVARTRAKLFLAQGGKDFEVHPVRDLKALRAAVKPKRRATVARYPGLDHHFKPEPGESSPGRYLDLSRTVDPKFVADLRAWVQRVTR